MRRFMLATSLLLVAATANAEIGPRLEWVLDGEGAAMRGTDGRIAVWVHFTDRGLAGGDLDAAIDAAELAIPPRTLARRAARQAPGTRLAGVGDVDLSAAYLQAVAATGAVPRRQSRWLNAASFDATDAQIDAIAALPFVSEVELVARFFRPELRLSDQQERAADLATKAAAEADGRWSMGYGGSTAGLEQINVPPVHEIGVTGAGVVIGMLDGGFRTTHAALAGVDVLAQWDFVGDDPIVDEEPGDPLNSARHGTHTLSTIMGYKKGEMVGPAYGASVILARTEDAGSETPIEEDNWIAGLEWVELQGADLVSTSLGYYYWYEFSDFDGNTALCTIAADLAVARGLCVVNSAGNTRGSDFPHVTAPADGDSVIAVGAVDLDAVVAPFSAPGPTFDGRIKPDLAALGVGNFVASYYDDAGYGAVNGTSFSAPLVAGVAALILERVPSLTPMQVREALRETADQANRPDNDLGWGLVDAYAALGYWGPTIEHEALGDTEDSIGPYAVTATITGREALDPATLRLRWRLDGGTWHDVGLTALGGQEYGAGIPGQPGGEVEYYLTAGDVTGITVDLPHGAPGRAYAFFVGADITAPELFHANLIDQTTAAWPPLVSALATDDLGIDQVELTFTHGGTAYGPFAMDPAGGGVFEQAFPLASGAVNPGDVISYEIAARDRAGTANTTVSGPHDFAVVANLGSVLVVDDNLAGAAGDVVDWVAEAGYTVDVIDAGAVVSGSFAGRDAVVLSCGSNGLPVAAESLRQHVIEWVESGGRLLIEGGEIAAKALHVPGYPEFSETVLHGAEWWGDLTSTSHFDPTSGFDRHFLLHRPHRLETPLSMVSSGGIVIAGGDLVLGADDAQVVLRGVYYEHTGGVLVYDDNTGPDAGQIVYLTFDIGMMTPGLAGPFVANALAYLTAREAPGQASIAGTVTLSGGAAAEGALVTANSGHSTTTAADGSYVLDGLHGSTYTVTASLNGFGPGVREVVLLADQVLEGIDFVLQPVVAVAGTASPDVVIPDNDSDGIASVITLATDGTLNAISIDIDVSHASIGNLTVTLTSPQGTAITLHDRSGGTNDDLVGNWPDGLTVDGPGQLADLVGEDIAGDWTLTVADHQFGALGTLHAWGLNLLVVPAPTPVHDPATPAATRLIGNAPNPFNPMTTIAFDLAAAGPVALEVFDVRGHVVRRLQAGHMPAGRHEIVWNGRDDGGREMASGVYFGRLQAGGEGHLVKMTLVR